MVSQLEARSRIRFSVRVLSNSPFRVQEIPRVRAAPHARSPGPALIRRRAHRVTRSSGHALIRVPASSRAKWNVYERKIEGAWVDGLAGGPRQWTVNPMYRLQFGAAASTPGPIEVALLLEAMRTYSVNVSVYDYRSPIISPSQNQRLATSGDYRAGFCYVEPPALQGAMGAHVCGSPAALTVQLTLLPFAMRRLGACSGCAVRRRGVDLSAEPAWPLLPHRPVGAAPLPHRADRVKVGRGTRDRDGNGTDGRKRRCMGAVVQKS